MSSVTNERITYIEIGRTSIVHTMNNDIKRSINKISSFIFEELGRPTFVSYHKTELWKGVIRGIYNISEDEKSHRFIACLLVETISDDDDDDDFVLKYTSFILTFTRPVVIG